MATRKLRMIVLGLLVTAMVGGAAAGLSGVALAGDPATSPVVSVAQQSQHDQDTDPDHNNWD